MTDSLQSSNLTLKIYDSWLDIEQKQLRLTGYLSSIFFCFHPVQNGAPILPVLLERPLGPTRAPKTQGFH